MTLCGLPVSNMVGSAKLPSAVITPATPVCAIHASASSPYKMLPFANTGIESSSRTVLMMSQSAMPVSVPFCLMVLPCTVKSWHPEALR